MNPVIRAFQPVARGFMFLGDTVRIAASSLLHAFSNQSCKNNATENVLGNIFMIIHNTLLCMQLQITRGVADKLGNCSKNQKVIIFSTLLSKNATPGIMNNELTSIYLIKPAGYFLIFYCNLHFYTRFISHCLLIYPQCQPASS